MSLQAKLISLTVVAALVAGLLFAVYTLGYNKAEGKYTKILDTQNQLVRELEAREQTVKIVTVVEYRDRIKTITKVEEKIVEVTRDVLGNEGDNCTIGPGFIRLHNAAATNKAISGSTPGATQNP